MSSEQREQRRYTREFKLEAVRLSEHATHSVAQVARDLGVPERMLYRWRQQVREQEQLAFPGTGHASQSEVEEENHQLHRQVELLRQERDILKKAVVIFSQPQL
jgi:transposase